MKKYQKLAETIAKLYDGKVKDNKVKFKNLEDAIDGADEIADQHAYTIDFDTFEIEFLNENIDVSFINLVCDKMNDKSPERITQVMQQFGYINESEIEGVTAQLERYNREKKYVYESPTDSYRFYISESQISSLKGKDPLERRQFLTHMGMRDLDADSVAENLQLLKKNYPEMDDNGELPVEGTTSNESNNNQDMTINETGLWMFGGIEVIGNSLKKLNHLMVNESNSQYVTFDIMSNESGALVGSGMFNRLNGITTIKNESKVPFDQWIEGSRIDESVDDYLYLKFADNVLYYLDFTKPLQDSQIETLTANLIETGVFPTWLADAEPKAKLKKALEIRKNANYVNESKSKGDRILINNRDDSADKYRNMTLKDYKKGQKFYAGQEGWEFTLVNKTEDGIWEVKNHRGQSGSVTFEREYIYNKVLNESTNYVNESADDKAEYYAVKNINEPKNLATEIVQRYYSKGEKLSRGGVKTAVKELTEKFMINESIKKEANFVGLMSEVEKQINESAVAYVVPTECYRNPWLTHQIQTNAGIRGYQFANQYGNNLVNAEVGGNPVGVYVNESNEVVYTKPIPYSINESGQIENIDELQRYVELRANEADEETRKDIQNIMDESGDNYGETIGKIDEAISSGDLKKLYVKNGFDRNNIFVKNYGGMDSVIFKKAVPNMMLADKIARKHGRSLALENGIGVTMQPISALAELDGVNGDYLKVYNSLTINESEDEERADESFELDITELPYKNQVDYLSGTTATPEMLKRLEKNLPKADKKAVIEAGQKLKKRADNFHKKGLQSAYNDTRKLYGQIESFLKDKYNMLPKDFLNESEDERIDEYIDAPDAKKGMVNGKEYKIKETNGKYFYWGHKAGRWLPVSKKDITFIDEAVSKSANITGDEVYEFAKRTKQKDFDLVYSSFNSIEKRAYQKYVDSGTEKNVALWTIMWERGMLNEAVTNNYPEMHGNTNTDVQATWSGIVRKYRVTSKNEIKVSKGIEFDGVVDKLGANSNPNKNAGWFKYYMTDNAFKKFTKDNDATLNILLD